MISKVFSKLVNSVISVILCLSGLCPSVPVWLPFGENSYSFLPTLPHLLIYSTVLYFQSSKSGSNMPNLSIQNSRWQLPVWAFNHKKSMDVILILPSSIFFSFLVVTSIRSGHLMLPKLWTVTLIHNWSKLLELIFQQLTDTSLPMIYKKQSVWIPWKLSMNQPFSCVGGELGIRKVGIFHGRWWLEQVGYSSFSRSWSSPLTMTWAIQGESKTSQVHKQHIVRGHIHVDWAQGAVDERSFAWENSKETNSKQTK